MTYRHANTAGGPGTVGAVTIAPDQRAIEVTLFRAVLRHQAASVAIITVNADQPVGFTATSFASVSADPPLVSFNLDRGSSSWPAVATADHLAVHLLGQGQEELARRFATTGIDRFTGTPWRPGPYGVPLLDGVPAWLVARVVRHIPAGDHAIVLAEPVLGEHRDDPQSPLVYHRGRYHSIG
jgi:flavin reductase (DIM6/NTAB) family NADH-FMN oxidoreductase RutF